MILTLTFIGAIVAAFILMIITLWNTNTKDSVRHELQLYAAEKGGRITLTDHWNNSAIGIDENIKTVYFISKNQDRQTKKEISLLPVKLCRLVQLTRTAGEGKKKQIITDSIQIALSYHDKSKPETSIEFYNSDYDKPTIVTELELATNWVEIINKIVSSK